MLSKVTRSTTSCQTMPPETISIRNLIKQTYKLQMIKRCISVTLYNILNQSMDVQGVGLDARLYGASSPLLSYRLKRGKYPTFSNMCVLSLKTITMTPTQKDNHPLEFNNLSSWHCSLLDWRLTKYSARMFTATCLQLLMRH